MNKIFQEYFLDDPVFKLVAIQKYINNIFEKQLQRNPLYHKEKWPEEPLSLLRVENALHFQYNNCV